MLDLLLVLGIAFITFITRVVNLLAIPIFTDEAIYIRWAQIGLADPAHRYIALTDGKQPLLTWLMYPMLKIFSDPLFAGRFVSVLSGTIAAVGIYFVARKLFDRKVALFSVLLYIISPFFLLYDRLALMDSLLAALGVWSLYLEIVLVTSLRLDAALILGITIGLGTLTKSSAFFYLYLIPASLLLFNFKAKHKLNSLLKWLGLSTVSLVIAQLMYNSLRLSPWFYLIRQKNYTFILTVTEFLKSPFALFISNLKGLTEFLFAYLTLPIDIVLIIVLIWSFIQKDKRIAYLFIWFLVPFLSLAAFGKVVFPRFLLFMTVPLLIIVGWGVTTLTNFALKRVKILLLLLPLIFAYPLYQSYLIIFSPVTSAIPQTDRNQLLDDWPSGYGVKEVVNYISEKANGGKVVLGTEGTFGLNPAVYEIYLGRNKNVEIHGYWPVGEVPKELLEASAKYPTYLVFKDKQEIPAEWPLTLVAKYKRGGGNTYLLLYQVNSHY